jgi:flagellar hook-basal body complex protein FliE
MDITSLSNFNSINDFNKIFQKNQESTKQFQLGIEETIQNSNELKNDKELSEDLKQLLKGSDETSNTEGISSTDSLSADKLYHSFSGALENSIHKLNSTQVASNKAFETFATGGNIDVHQVMLASRQASLSMELATKMQSKIVQAYQELSKMGV